MNRILILLFTFCLGVQNIALVTKSKGDAQYKKNQSTSGDKKLAMGTQLFSNDLIKTGTDGFAIFVYLDDKSMIKVQNNSEMYIRVICCDKYLYWSLVVSFNLFWVKNF